MHIHLYNIILLIVYFTMNSIDNNTGCIIIQYLNPKNILKICSTNRSIYKLCHLLFSWKYAQVKFTIPNDLYLNEKVILEAKTLEPFTRIFHCIQHLDYNRWDFKLFNKILENIDKFPN